MRLSWRDLGTRRADKADGKRVEIVGFALPSPPMGGADGKANMQVFVRDNDVNGALRVLKKKMQREGVFREMKQRRAYEKPSERAAREKAEGVRRRRKALRNRMEREGY